MSGREKPTHKIVEQLPLAIYRFIFGRSFMVKINIAIYKVALRGIGILNYINNRDVGEAALLRKLTKSIANSKEHPVIVDVGANEGEYSILMKQAVPNSIVHAFEPHPETAKRLRKMASQYGFNVWQLGCADKSGSSYIYDHAESEGTLHATLHKEVITELYGKGVVQHKIKIVSLDNFMTENKINHIDLLKIDTEGSELNILKGASKAIKQGKIDAIHFEFNEMNIISRTFFRDFVEILSEYKLFRILPYGLMPLNNYEPVLYEIFAYQNIVAVRKGCDLRIG